ncbi:hypothetical protein CFIMG_008596RA00001 [Ceratocystis fimbriata CBS 114723]|uniref:FAR1 domain-containing protein n=1 Tax=Ceratocystis fimbriata CBS 114723 TaxID=1035309 RepID=A0A2C5WW01_9PEZI|nr:hypothetical protein CFIMG_008596RA00001 [Ceratocystis fimbriata CBS 114723]
MDPTQQHVKIHVQEQSASVQGPTAEPATVSQVDVAVLAAVASASASASAPPTPVLSVPATEAPVPILPIKAAAPPAPAPATLAADATVAAVAETVVETPDANISPAPQSQFQPHQIPHAHFENIKDARKALDAYAESAGYKMCVMKTLPTAVVWRCSQNGRRRTRPPTTTHPSKQRKHRLKERSGCRWKIRAVKRPRLRDGEGSEPPAVEWIWTIRESDNPDARTHNHDMMDPASFASYRMKAAVSVKDIIFTMVDAGVKPIHIVAELKGRAKALNRPALSSIKSRDIHNLVQAQGSTGEGVTCSPSHITGEFGTEDPWSRDLSDRIVSMFTTSSRSLSSKDAEPVLPLYVDMPPLLLVRLCRPELRVT